MKKSIVAMLSITALATVANAGDPFTAPTGTHFEGIQNGAAFYPSNDDAGNTAGPNFFWYAATNGVACEAQFGVYTNADYMGSSYSGDRPATPEATTITDRCLSIDTEGERLIRRMGPAPLGSWSNPDFDQYDVTSAIYFDSLVQFTVNEDDAPTMQEGDKLAVWLKGGDTTNLVIKAGYLNYAVGVDPVTPTNYVVQTTTNIVPNTWYRLTIEAIPLITGYEGQGQGKGYLGFRVRINGSYVTCTESRGATANVIADWADQAEAVDISDDQGIFPSLVRGGELDVTSDTLSCVAFEGTGALDDFVFTTSNPFPDAPTPEPTFDVAVMVADNDCKQFFFGAKYVVGSGTNDFDSTTLSASVPVGTESVTVLALVAENDGAASPSELKIAEADGFTKGDSDGAGHYYWSKVITTSGQAADTTNTVSITIEKIAPAVPTVNGKKPADGDAFIAAATSGTANVLPNGWTLDGNVIKDGNGDTYATIPTFYTATLTDGTLTLVLNTTALPTIGTATIASEEKEAIEVGDTKFTATLTGTEAKLYYGLSVATTPNPANWPTPASLTKGTGSAMQLTADKPVDGSTVAPAAFFKVYVTDIAPTAPAPTGE